VRVAALADVHGNAPALEAVLAEVANEDVDAIVFCGDLTWGPLPRETLELVRALRIQTHFVRGNADRSVGVALEGRGGWMADQHDEQARAFVHDFADHVTVDVNGLGATRFVHGSPRSDEECVTERTPPERVREFMTGVDERVVVTAHVHVSYDRLVDGVRLLSPGSVGMPYEGRPGAHWALLGPDVEHRRAEYDLERTIELYRASGLPDVEQIVEITVSPPERAEVIEHAESVVFSG
jgi:putative phosphoesterase